MITVTTITKVVKTLTLTDEDVDMLQHIIARHRLPDVTGAGGVISYNSRADALKYHTWMGKIYLEITK